MSIHEKWFISDTHFFHSNMLKFKEPDGSLTRPEFATCKEMDETMLKNWNSVVGVNDYVYHLGDVTFRYDGVFNELMSQLKGRKRLIIGNHDKLKNPNLLRWFEKAELWKGFKEGNFTCTHFPHSLAHLRDGAFNVHGHVHRRSLKDSPKHINMSVEVRGYTPTHLDQILAEIQNAT